MTAPSFDRLRMSGGGHLSARRKLTVVLSAIGLLALGYLELERALRPLPPLPVYGALPAFELIDENGRSFDRGSLAGHVWIVNFIFTSCPTVCPLLSQRMEMLQERLKGSTDRIRLASFSVDPETDTPPVLKAYGARYHQDPSRWTFVTGKPDDVLRAIGDGFKVVVERTRNPGEGVPVSPDGFAIVHGENFVLVDTRGRIRGYYHRDDEDQSRLVADVHRLARELGP